jgi:hypothetical protein
MLEPSEGSSYNQPDPTQTHVYQEVTHVSWGQRLLGSLAGLLFGLLLFVGAFVLLFFNEGSTDFSQMASRAEVLSAAVVQPQAEGKTVALTGPITSPDLLGDNLYLKPGSYIALARTAEMFAWQESVETKTQTNVGGSETRVKTYRYSSDWTDQPKDSRLFKQSNYVNPAKSIPNQVLTVPSAKIGAYRVDMTSLTEVINFPYSCTSDSRRNTPHYSGGITLPPGNRLNLPPQNLLSTQAQPVGNYLFQGAGKPQAPKIGDLRICYSALPNQATVTVLGQLQGDQLVPTQYQNQTFFRLSYGSREAAIADLKSTYLTWLWFLRLLGFLMMWAGLALLAQPVNVLLSVVPFLGELSELISGAASFMLAFVLSFITIIVSSLVHQPIVLLGSIGVTLAVFLLGRILLKLSYSR